MAVAVILYLSFIWRDHTTQQKRENVQSSETASKVAMAIHRCPYSLILSMCFFTSLRVWKSLRVII